jgi:ligand-binding sensor domain-containing protein/signal transduction histidine kinase
MLVGCKKKRLTLLLISWIFSCSSIFTQTRQLNFINYNVKDGMSHGIVDAFVRDKEGFLWIATYNGLDRFDGTNFKIFHSDYHNSNAIVDNYVHDVCEDKEGNIWCGCEKGVSCYNKSTGKFNNYRLSNPHGFNVNANHVYNILCDRHGTIWCASDAGIFEFDKKHNKFIGYYHSEKDSTSPSGDAVYKNSFIEDPKQDGIWLATPQGINYLDLKTKKFYNHRNNPDHLPVFFKQAIFPIAFDVKGNLWFAGKNSSSLSCYNPSAKTLTISKVETDKPAKLQSLATIFFDSKGNTWFSTWNSKLFYKEREAKFFKQVVHDNANINSVGSGFVWDIIEDKDGTLWFGSSNGISKLQPSSQNFSLLKPNESLPSTRQFKFINALYQQNDSLLWLGTNSGLYLYNLTNGKCKKSGDSTYINYIIPVNKELWLIGIYGIKVFDPVSKKFINTNPLPNEWKVKPREIRNLHACRNGDIWLVTGDTKELYQLRKSTNKWINYKHDAHNPHSSAAFVTQAMHEDDNGTMWFGTIEDGIMRFDAKQSRFDFFQTPHTNVPKMRIEYPVRICSNKNNELYLMLDRNGLMKFNYHDNAATLYQQTDGLATEANFDMLKDSAENIWLAGYQDVTAFNTQKKVFKSFRIDYSYDDFEYGNVLMLFKNGDVGVSILDAIAIFKPAILNQDKSSSPVLVSDFSVFENSIPFTQKDPNIHLNYKQNFFTISFSNFSWSKNDLQYAYRLEGFDKNWVYCGKRQIASYTNVPGGDYTFSVKVSTKSGVWSLPTTVHIVITPPFWQTGWFKFLLAVLVIIIVAVIFKLRERNYRAKQEQKLQVLKVRDKIAQDLHDDIGASLSSIRMYSEVLRMQVKEKLPQADVILERISENSKEIVNNMSDIVWAINPKNDSLQFMEDRMHAFASAVCSSKNIIPHFNKIDFHELKLPMEMRKNIFLIFKEAINNAAKYSGCKNIFVDMQMHTRMFMLSIADDGKGFDIISAAIGNGLTNMRKRAQELKGEISIKSELNKGTIIKLSLLLPEVSQVIPLSGE